MGVELVVTSQVRGAAVLVTRRWRDVMGAINFVLGAFLRVDLVVLPLFVQGEVPALFCGGAEQDWPMCSPCLQNTLFSATVVSVYTTCRNVHLIAVARCRLVSLLQRTAIVYHKAVDLTTVTKCRGRGR
jgi:hypothetical protein